MLGLSSLLLCGAIATPPLVAPSSQDRPRLVVLELAHDDAVSAPLAAALGSALAEGLLVQTSFRTVAKDELRSLLATSGPVPMTCSDEDCLAHVARKAGASLVAFGTVNAAGQTPVLEAGLFDAAARRVVERRTVEGKEALSPSGAQLVAAQLLFAAEQEVGLAPPAWLVSPWMAAGTVLVAGGVVIGGAAAVAAVASSWVFHNPSLDLGSRLAARWVNYAGWGALVVAAGMGAAGIGAGTVALLIE